FGVSAWQGAQLWSWAGAPVRSNPSSPTIFKASAAMLGAFSFVAFPFGGVATLVVGWSASPIESLFTDHI
ncbi:hypothetical protein KW419_22395, partial [Vibrio fluvialis]|nr:hypothetical protein [Vibrio fluvialis]